MEKLMVHTLRKQLADQSARVDALSKQLAELSTTLKGPACQGVPALQAGTSAAPGESQTVMNLAGINLTQNNVTQNSVTQTVNTTIVVHPWDDGKGALSVSPAQLQAAFAESARLQEFAALDYRAMTDHATAPPYVTELFVDMVRRGHADPAARNIYLNPKRADQVLVYTKAGDWEVRPMGEASQMLLNGVAASIHRAVAFSARERASLPTAVQNALAIAGMVFTYQEEAEPPPEAYAKRAKAPLAAHLENMRPTAVRI